MSELIDVISFDNVINPEEMAKCSFRGGEFVSNDQIDSASSNVF